MANIISLPLNTKKRDNISRRLSGFNVFLSRYTLELEKQDVEAQHEFLFEELEIEFGGDVVSDADSTVSDYSAQQHPLPYKYRLKITSRVWARMCSDMKRGWEQKAKLLNDRPLPGRLYNIPELLGGGESATLKNLVMESLYIEWGKMVKTMRKLIIYRRRDVGEESNRVVRLGKE